MSTNDAFYEIDPEGDLTIKVIEYNVTIRDGNGRHPVLNTASFKVSRQTIIDKSKSQPLKAMLGGKFLEGHSNTIALDEHTITSVDVWLRYFHNAFDDACYSVPIKEVWNVLAFADQYLIDPCQLEDWFETYWSCVDSENLELQEMRQYLYPAYNFDHADAFAYLTKKLAYESADHVTEINPTGYRNLHLDGNVIGSINGVRGTLRGKLIRSLFDPVSAFLKSKCDCREKALFAYNLGLSKTGIWPLHEHHKKSVQEVLDSPGFVTFQCEIPEGACYTCKSGCNPAAVETVRHSVINHFDGLCLDCMKKTKFSSVDQDYWEHDTNKEWGRSCRIKHGQPTWYFSFMGRKTDMERHQQRKKVLYESRRPFYVNFY